MALALAVHNKTLLHIATKLSLNEEIKVLSKAAEFERLLQTRWTSSNIMSDTCKLVICLDLAAALFDVNIDTKLAIKYSGMKSQMYLNCRNTVENLLGINTSKLTLASICVTMQCTAAQNLATELLKEYQKCLQKDDDLIVPHHLYMAVYQACRINKDKIAKKKFLEISRLKYLQWEKLETEWTDLVKSYIKREKGANKVSNIFDKEVTEENLDINLSMDDLKNETLGIEPYEDWRNRILKEAYRELEEGKRQNFRKSPRKSPYKVHLTQQDSPRKAGHLLFP